MRTRFTFAFAAFTAVGLILAAQLGAFQSDETRPIPLDTAYVTFNQEGMKSIDDAATNEHLAQILTEVQGGPPRMALCAGKDIAAAVKASWVGFTTPEEAVPGVSIGESDPVWVAVYLGSDGSIPPAYKVRSIEMADRTIRVAYERDESPERSCDLRAYMLWAPIGRVEPGIYLLELFDAGTGNVTVSRSCRVTLSKTAHVE